MKEYIELYENSFQNTEATEKQHHNSISQEAMPTEVREGMLSVESKSLQLYNELSDTIYRNNIKTCQSIKAVKPSTTTSKKRTTSEAAAGHRVLEIAQARGYSTKELFRYDLIPTF